MATKLKQLKLHFQTLFGFFYLLKFVAI